MERISILHTNDIHSHLENWPRIQRFLVQQRQKRELAGQTVYAVDIGDAIDRVHPLTEASMGKANIELMNSAQYDAVTIGNNEGLGMPKKALDHLYDHAHFPVVLDNLRIPDTQVAPQWSSQAVLKTTKRGTRVLFWGLTAPYDLTYSLNQWSILPVTATLKQLTKQFQNSYDVLILLSHLGLPTDRQIAEQFSNIDLIIGSHTHHLLPNGERHGKTLLAAAGKYGENVGTIELLIDGGHQLVKTSAKTVATATLPVQPSDANLIQGWQTTGEQQLAQQHLTENPVRLQTDWDRDNPVARLALKIFADFVHTDLGVVNDGLFLTDLPQGSVTRLQLHQMLPHALHLMRVQLSGYDLWRLIAEMESCRQFLINFPMHGMGFRGSRFGNLQYLGFHFNQQSRQLWVANQLVIPDKQYAIVVPDNYLLIPFFPTISIIGKNQIFYNKLLREVVADAIRVPEKLAFYEGGGINES